jgi:hypothetical protein
VAPGIPGALLATFSSNDSLFTGGAVRRSCAWNTGLLRFFTGEDGVEDPASGLGWCDDPVGRACGKIGGEICLYTHTMDLSTLVHSSTTRTTS